MTSYLITFWAKRINAIGISQTHVKRVNADTEADAIRALYDEYEHCQILRVRAGHAHQGPCCTNNDDRGECRCCGATVSHG